MLHLNFRLGDGILENVRELTIIMNFDRGFDTGAGWGCIQTVADPVIPDGNYDPDLHNPNDLPDLACKAEDTIVHFTFERIGV